jgi:CHAT domain-containing protein
VDDEATRKLMERFYLNYWKNDMGTLETLREAQLWMLRSSGLRGADRDDDPPAAGTLRTPPYYWAAFVLSGDWR